MMISTRGRYALRVMIDLAEHSDGNYIAMKSVAAGNLSQIYGKNPPSAGFRQSD